MALALEGAILDIMMKNVVAAAIAVLLLVPLLGTPTQAARRSNRIAIDYVAPKDPEHRLINERLKEVRFLERLKEFLSPFRLPATLLVKFEGCDGEANAWYEEQTITICYEYVAEILKTVPDETTPQGVSPIDALIGPVFDTALHEFGHAIFEMLKLPVFGREEDAADQVAAFITLQLGRDMARRLIGGTAHAYMVEARAASAAPQLQDYANVHGTPAQRFYNLLCIAYGADPKFSEDMVQKGYLPKDRADDCEDEYKQAAYAFEKLIRPHMDQRLAKKVLQNAWLPPPTTVVRRKPPAHPIERKP